MYLDGSSFTVAVDSTRGGNFEQLVTSDTATVIVEDTVDVVTATLTVDKENVTEGAEISYTVTLSGPAGMDFSQHGGLTFTLDNGEVVTIDNGNLSGSSDPVDTRGQSNIVNSISSVSGGEEYEQLVTTGITSVGVNHAPIATGTEVEDLEDTSGITINLSAQDSDGSIESFIIHSLPENGTLQIDGVHITSANIGTDGLTVSSDAVIVFIPTKDWSGDTSFNYQAVDNAGAISSQATTEIKVLPVTDLPWVTVELGEPESQQQKINISNVNVEESDKNFTVSAVSNGKNGVISRIEFDPDVGSGKVNGFGVKGNISNNGNEKEIDPFEAVAVRFEQPVTDVAVKFSWLATNEYAKYTLFDANGNNIGSGIVRGQTDKIDPSVSLSSQSNGGISRIEFTGAGENDKYSGNKIGHNNSDYVIHEITYTTPGTKIYPLEIQASTTDVDGSEEITSIIVKVPEDAVLSHGTLLSTDQDGVSSWELPLTSNQGYTVTSLNDGKGGIKIDGVTVTIAATDNLEVEVIATAKDGDAAARSASDTDLVMNSLPVEDAPAIGVVSAGVASEGQSLDFAINLDKPVDNDTQVTFTLGQGANDQASAEDIGVPTVSINGSEVVLTAHTDGSYSFLLPAGITTGIQISVPTTNDGLLEGDELITLNATLNGETADGLLLPAGLTDTGTGIIAEELYIAKNNNNDDFSGSKGNDVLLGDVGGASSIVTPGTNYNVSLILDTSGSMKNASGTGSLSRLALAVKAIGNLVTQLQEHDGIINLQLVDFAKKADSITINNLDASNALELTNYLNKLTAGGGTNYEAAFKEAADWFDDQSEQTAVFENVSFFLTDGKPTYYLDGEDDVAGTGNSTDYNTFSNSVDGFKALSDISLVHGVGIGNDIAKDYLQFFDNSSASGQETIWFGSWWSPKSVTGNVGDVDIVNTADELDAALQSGNTTHELAALGADIIDGGDGNDIIFGDSINTDNLSWGSLDKPDNLPDGSGLSALKAFLKAQNNGQDASDEQLYNYIREHHDELDIAGDERGGHDTLRGGSGDDVIYGQGGDDHIEGGEGNDIIYGGTGADHLSGGLGDDIIDLGTGELVPGIVDLNTAGLIADGAADTLYWSAEEAQSGKSQHDVVKSFELGTDKLDLTDFLIDDDSGSIGSLTAEADGNDTVIKVTSGTGAELSITLDGVSYEQDILNQVLVDELVGKLLDNG
ncbi:immunoglobulin-like domain-containing protein [Oceanisphaera marina]|uniref:immunoglobulin-like domain-containing protein n=1 Tax=Oceanisphaera marina TaxID=2017550 RepID=UPI001E492510|nr:immunoglobulin-like domain-containing protein [Oceanisphaera marina]